MAPVTPIRLLLTAALRGMENARVLDDKYALKTRDFVDPGGS